MFQGEIAAGLSSRRASESGAYQSRPRYQLPRVAFPWGRPREPSGACLIRHDPDGLSAVSDLSIYLSIYLLGRAFLYLSIILSIHLSIYPSFYLSLKRL